MKAILLKLLGCSFILIIVVPIMPIECIASDVSKQISSQAAPPETMNPTKMKEDIDFLVKTIKDSHPNMYAYISREDFKKALSQLVP